MPPVAKVHADKYLTNISIGYSNEELIADKIFLRVDVDKQSDKYYVFGYEKFGVEQDLRAPGTESNEVTWDFSDDSFYCDGHALSTFVTDEEYENADEVLLQELEANATELVTEKIKLSKEVDAANKLTDTSLIDTDLHATPAVKWNDYGNAASNPQMDIEKAKAKLHTKAGLTPNTLVVSKPVYDALLFHPKLLALLGSNSLQMLTHQMLETILGVRIMVGKALRNTNPNNRPAAGMTPAYIWGTTAVLLYIAPKAVGKKTRTFGMSFYWTKRDGGAIEVRKWYEVAKQATKIEAQHYYDQKIISKNSSYIFVDPISVA